ncbi:unnamed protein product [Auanema sp. JU1783]|nr:unnamed protein product [Auanema sp. JU1783]
MANKYMSVLEGIIGRCKNYDTFMKSFGKVRAVVAEEGKAKIEFDVTEELTNNHGTLHGGCAMTIVDICTTTLCAMTPRGVTGVSVNLNMNYLTPAKLGETVVVDARILRMGNTIAYTEAELYLKTSGKMVAKGLHTMALPKPKK